MLVARSADRLQRLAGELAEFGAGAEVLVADLQSDQGMASVAERLQADRPRPVDVLVNNAGFGSIGSFSELPVEGAVAEITVNVVAVVRLCRSALPGMLHRRHGGILNVASLAAFVPGAGMANYSATKAFVLSLTEALREETAGRGVRITALCPGYTRTGFQQRAGVRAEGMPGFAWQDAAEVAAAGWAGFRQGTAVVVPGTLNKLSAAGVRFAPRPVVRKLAALSIRQLG